MGIDATSAIYLLSLKRSDTNFSSVLTLGRQDISHIRAKDFDEIVAKSKIAIDDKTKKDITSDKWADDLFRYLGASSVEAIDASDYEGADHIHDLNDSVPIALHDKYDVVFDGGTLEHVYNIPNALLNCMKMVKIGGHFISIAVCNNFVGHGFYQFSPEFFFRSLSKKRGFEIKDAIFVELGHSPIRHPIWHRVPDPDVVRGRVTFTGNKRVYMIIRAQKISSIDLSGVFPQQSDYENIRWKHVPSETMSTNPIVSSYRAVRKAVIANAPDVVMDYLRDVRARRRERQLLQRMNPYE
ncbi:hypothetical protein ACO2RV_07340 [Ancylobacter sp. VNQ12]|uniref:hypothetical protein n=1 Tax=Ancylobacter sp. VNQ12 TaxID=3400920 RepID=UPI003BFE83F9